MSQWRALVVRLGSRPVNFFVTTRHMGAPLSLATHRFEAGREQPACLLGLISGVTRHQYP